MDHLWAANQLRVFVMKIDQLAEMSASDLIEQIATHRTDGVTAQNVADELLSPDPVMRVIMNAARRELGDYTSTRDAQCDHYSSTYWSTDVKPPALQARGIHDLGAEAREKLRPDSPDLVADQFHDWVWKAASPLWQAGSTQAAVLAAAQSVNARLQQQLHRHDAADAALCRDAFSNMLIPGKRQQGLIVTCLIGIAGALFGGWVATNIFHHATVRGFFNGSTWITAIAGAAVLLLAYHLVTSHSGRRPARR